MTDSGLREDCVPRGPARSSQPPPPEYNVHVGATRNHVSPQLDAPPAAQEPAAEGRAAAAGATGLCQGPLPWLGHPAASDPRGRPLHLQGGDALHQQG